ncbi:MAG: IS701 family transposase [Saprospiraceae bacterium]
MCGRKTNLGRCQEYLKGLFHDCKSNIERMQERIPNSEYQQLQHFISHSPWDAFGVMHEVARRTESSFEHISGSVGLLLDESGWQKTGRKSVGVARQYIGQAGKISNGQVGVFTALCKGDKVGLVQGRLYLPREWTDDAERCAKAGIPMDQAVYRSKTQLAVEMIQALEDDISYEWIGGDAVYGNSLELRATLRKMQKSYVLDVEQQLSVYLSDPEPFIPPAQIGAKGRPRTRHISRQEPVVLSDLLSRILPGQWTNLTYRQGTKGFQIQIYLNCQIKS